MIKYTKQIAYAVGVVSSLFISAQYTGTQCILSFTINLINNSATTYIISKLDELKIFDGISIAVVLGCLAQLPRVILGLISKGFLEAIISILSIFGLGYINYKLLKHENNHEINYSSGLKDKIDISTKGYCSMVMCNLYYLSILLSKLGASTSVISGLVILLSPILTYCMSTGSDYQQEVNKYLKRNNAFIDSTRHDEDTIRLIDNELLRESIKQGLVNGTMLGLSIILVKVLELSISPLYIGLTVSSLVNVSFSVKSIIKEKSIKGFLS